MTDFDKLMKGCLPPTNNDKAESGTADKGALRRMLAEILDRLGALEGGAG